MRFLLWLISMEVIVDGKENMPQQECILAAVPHFGHPDTLALMAGVTEVTMVAKRAYWGKLPRLVLLKLLTSSKYVLVDSSSQGSVREMINLLKQHRMNLGVFPQGTRDPSGQTEITAGVFFLARQAGAPIVPVVIEGQKLMPKGEGFVKTLKAAIKRKFTGDKVTVIVHILPAVEFAELNGRPAYQHSQMSQTFRRNLRDYFDKKLWRVPGFLLDK